jgi:hypothetical protein
MLRSLTGGLAAVALTGGGAGAQAAQLSAADRSFVDQTVCQAMVRNRLPGVSIAISGPRSYRDFVFAPLRAQHDLVFIDQRGGISMTPSRAAPLISAAPPTITAAVTWR